MAITKHSIHVNRYFGASTDTKPTTEGSSDVLVAIPVGSTFFEYDTGVLYVTYDGTNWVVKDDGGIGSGALFSIATGAAAIAKAVNPAVKFRLLAITLHLSSAPTTSQSLTATLDAGDGSAYDVVLVSRDLSVGSVTDQVWVFGLGYEFEADDHIDIAYTNTDERTYGLRIIYELI